MTADKSALAGWTPAEIEIGKQWVETWEKTGIELERIRRSELRELDTFAAIVKLCADYDYRVPPRAPKPYSGLVEQQRIFRKLRSSE